MKQKKAREFQTKLGELQAVYAKLQRELAEEEMKIQQQKQILKVKLIYLILTKFLK